MKNFFWHKGCASRTEYWMTCLVCVALICVAGPMIDKLNDSLVLHDFSIFCLVFVCCWIFSAVSARRCQDLGISRWNMFNPKYWLDILSKKGMK